MIKRDGDRSCLRSMLSNCCRCGGAFAVDAPVVYLYNRDETMVWRYCQPCVKEEQNGLQELVDSMELEVRGTNFLLRDIDKMLRDKGI